MSAQPLSARRSTKRRTRSADLRKSQSSASFHSRVSSSSKVSRWAEETFRKSNRSGVRTAGAGSSRAAIWGNYSVPDLAQHAQHSTPSAGRSAQDADAVRFAVTDINHAVRSDEDPMRARKPAGE